MQMIATSTLRLYNLRHFLDVAPNYLLLILGNLCGAVNEFCQLNIAGTQVFDVMCGQRYIDAVVDVEPLSWKNLMRRTSVPC